MFFTQSHENIGSISTLRTHIFLSNPIFQEKKSVILGEMTGCRMGAENIQEEPIVSYSSRIKNMHKKETNQPNTYNNDDMSRDHNSSERASNGQSWKNLTNILNKILLH